MQTIKYTKMDKDKIINRLLQGEILAFPTDTVFGLGCIIDRKAIKKIYEAKGRSFDKPLPMMCNSLQMIETVAKVSEDAKKIINKFMPGALTLIFEKKEEIEDYVTNGKDTIAIRMPDDPWILDIIESLKQPILVTSANISNSGSLIDYQDVLKELDGKIDGIVCENAKGSLNSTIIDITQEIKIVREGPIKIEEIMESLK